MERSAHEINDPLIDAVLDALSQLGVREERIVVAVSGGPDSVALLYALIQLQDPFALRLHVAHLNHLLRDDRGAEDAGFVRELAERLGVPSTIVARDVRAHQQNRRNSSLEDAARDLRHEFLSEVAEKAGASRIAVGHTADDQAETVLLHLVRGTGLSGLRGMQPVRGRIIRPLLGVRRSAVEAFLTSRKIPFRVDETNLCRDFARNRMRNEVMPLLQRDFNPRAVENIARTARLVRSAEEWADSELDKVFADLIVHRSKSSVRLSVSSLLQLPALLRQLAIRRAIREFAGEMTEMSLAHVQSVEDLIGEGSSAGQVSLPGTVMARRSGEALEILVRREKESAVAWELPIEIPGEYLIPESSLLFQCHVVARTGVLSEAPNTEPHEAFMDWGRVEGGLVIRNRRAGDRFHPLGAPGTRKLKDFFIDTKVPQPDRDRVPLLADAQGIICVLGYVIAERVRVTPETREFLHVLLQGRPGTMHE